MTSLPFLKIKTIYYRFINKTTLAERLYFALMFIVIVLCSLNLIGVINMPYLYILSPIFLIPCLIMFIVGFYYGIDLAINSVKIIRDGIRDKKNVEKEYELLKKEGF